VKHFLPCGQSVISWVYVFLDANYRRFTPLLYS
jgi:hypothetical protein